MFFELHKLVVTIVSLQQLISCVVIRENREIDSLDRFRNFLLSIPNVEQEKVDKFVDLFKNMATKYERGGESLLELLFARTNIPKDEQAEIIDVNSYITDEDLVNIERNLNNKLTSNETEKIMRIVRKLKTARTSEELLDAVIMKENQCRTMCPLCGRHSIITKKSNDNSNILETHMPFQRSMGFDIETLRKSMRKTNPLAFAECTNKKCGYKFCIKCQFAYHDDEKCPTTRLVMPIQTDGGGGGEKLLYPTGSRSKRNLRRLCSLDKIKFSSMD